MAADGHAPAFDVPTEALIGRARNVARRSITINASRTSKGDLVRLQMQRNDETIAEYERPVTRGDCLPGGCNGARPCPWVSCKAHLALDVDERTGSIKVNFPDLKVSEMSETCALDIADRGGITLEEVGAVMNVGRERVRQIEVRALAGVAQASTLLEYLDAPPTIHRAPPVPTNVSRLGRPRLRAERDATRAAKKRGPGHLIARMALERGASVPEAAEVSGLTVRSTHQLAWRVRRETARGAR
jgi:hypothetical protein